MESNISRDHIAMEAMKVILSQSIDHEQTLWNRICVLFGGKNKANHKSINAERCAVIAYRYADAMLEERMKDRSLQKSEDNEAE